jgi:hypothetical protein
MPTTRACAVILAISLTACDRAPDTTPAEGRAVTHGRAAVSPGGETAAQATQDDGDTPAKVQPAPEPEAPAAPVPEKAAVKPTLGRLSERAFDALLAQVGCPDGKRSALGCSVCPARLNPTARDFEHEYIRAPSIRWKAPAIMEFDARPRTKRAMHAFKASFAHGAADHMLLYYNCSLAGDEEETALPNEVYLVSNGKLVGVLEGYKDDTSLQECAFPRDGDGNVHVLCIQERGRMGTHSMGILRVHDPTTGDEDFSPASVGLTQMPGFGEVEGEVQEAGVDFPGWFRMTFTDVRDVDGDGDEDVIVSWHTSKTTTLVQGEGGTFTGRDKNE